MKFQRMPELSKVATVKKLFLPFIWEGHQKKNSASSLVAHIKPGIAAVSVHRTS